MRYIFPHAAVYLLQESCVRWWEKNTQHTHSCRYACWKQRQCASAHCCCCIACSCTHHFWRFLGWSKKDYLWSMHQQYCPIIDRRGGRVRALWLFPVGCLCGWCLIRPFTHTWFGFRKPAQLFLGVSNGKLISLPLLAVAYWSSTVLPWHPCIACVDSYWLQLYVNSATFGGLVDVNLIIFPGFSFGDNCTAARLAL